MRNTQTQNYRFPRIYNYISQIRNRRIKIFFIGFNKCATTALHSLMSESGIKSIHWIDKEKNNIAVDIFELIKKNNLISYSNKFTAISDMFHITSNEIIEGDKFYREYMETFPNSYFILNDRSVEEWINSRARHRKGTLLLRYMDYYGESEAETKERWRRDHETHVRDVLNYFEGYQRFLHFHVDSDSPELLADFLAPTFRVDPRRWTAVNVTKKR